MANHDYTVIIQDTEPDSPRLLWIWINPVTGGIYLRLVEEWIPIGGGDTFTSITGVFLRTEYDQTSEPGTPRVGDGWLNDNNQNYIYLDKWIVLTGG